MENIKQDLNKIKDYLYESHLEVTMSKDFDSLIKLKNVNDELRETLILLHSNYKAEFQAIKNHNFRVLLSILDSQATAFDKVIAKQLEMSNILDSVIKSKTSKTISVVKILTLLAGIASFIIVIFYLFNSDKETGQMVIDLMKSLVPKIF